MIEIETGIIGIIVSYVISTILSLSVLFYSIKYDILNLTNDDIFLIFISSFIPIGNLLNVYYGVPEVFKNFKNRKRNKSKRVLKKEEMAFNILETVDIKYIERFLRKKKLKKIR